jgi:BetI-type transcriptional repressor, C-terminal
VAALGRVARGSGGSRAKLEQAMRILFAAYGADDPEFPGLFLTGWARARHDKQYRLTLAWQREQIRLSIEDILSEGIRTREFRPDLDAGALAAVVVGAAEGCLLQAATEGGSVTGDRVIQSLLALTARGPVSGA